MSTEKKLDPKLCYLHPYISLRVEVEKVDGGSVWQEHNKYTCRETVIGNLWTQTIFHIPEVFSKVTGLEIIFDFPLPRAHSDWDKRYNPGVADQESPPGKEMAKFLESKKLQKDFLEFCTISGVTSALACVGPAALSGGKTNLSIDKARNKMVLKMNCFTPEIIKHPAILSVILGQVRWAGDQLVSGELSKCIERLNPGKNLKRLASSRKSGKMSPATARLLKVLLKRTITLSDTDLVKKCLDRYAINKTTAPALNDLFKQMRTGTEWKKSWECEVDTMYKTLAGYGVYKWMQKNCPNKYPLTLTNVNHVVQISYNVRFPA